MVRALLLLCLFLLASCGDDATGGTPDGSGGDASASLDPLRDDCEALVPEFCALPFPSDYWLRDDARSSTGHRVALGATTLSRGASETFLAPEPLNARDGWSINANLIAYLPGATSVDMASPRTIERSLEAGSLTVLLDTETGERVAHWAEIDRSFEEAGERVILIRAAAPLEHGRRYVVGIRGVQNEAGAVIPAPATFAALRDGTPSNVPSVEGRREAFADVLTSLSNAGVDPLELQLAWDFTTGSLEGDTGDMVAVRDLALAAVGPEGPAFEITSVVEPSVEEDPNIARRITGLMTVPLYLDQPDAGARLVRDAEGRPMQNGTAAYEFLVLIPRSATVSTPATPVIYGHGQLGDKAEIRRGIFRRLANEQNVALIAVDWIGFAENDVPFIAGLLLRARLRDWEAVADRQVQGVANFMMAMRMMEGAPFRTAPELSDAGTPIVSEVGYYLGASQGGIFGATLMSLFTDVTRGVLVVPGQPYNLLLTRSKNFDLYRGILRTEIAEGPSMQIALAYIQSIWDRIEPGSYSGHIREDLFPGTPAHEVLLVDSIGDHQVTTLGAHTMARAIGAGLLMPTSRPVFGLEPVFAPLEESALIELDWGLIEPIENVPLREGDDPHNAYEDHPGALQTIFDFLRTGTINHPCEGPCDPF